MTNRELFWRGDTGYLAIVLAAASLLGAPIILFGLPHGHSLIENLLWSQEFARQLLAGDLYPRWLGHLNGGAGSPIFYFYGPFPFYLSSFITAFCQTCSPTIPLALSQCIVFAASGLAFFFLIRMDFSAAAACIAAIVYLLLPYHLEIDLWRRQAFGEFTAYLWIPLILIFTRRIVSSSRGFTGLAASYAGLLYTRSRLLSFSPPLARLPVLYAGEMNWYQESPDSSYPCFLAWIGRAVPLPALTTQHLITSERWWMPGYNYAQWFFLDGNRNRTLLSQHTSSPSFC